MSLREAVVDLAAIRDNVGEIAARVRPAAVLAVVKADAYGHGAVEVARAAVEGGAEWLGVADIREALEVRTAGIDVPVLAWLHDAEADFATAAAAWIDLGVNSLDQLERAAAAGATVHLKVDTGLSRNGIPRSEFPRVAARAAELERAGSLGVRGVFSHLANGGAAADAAQLAAFEEALSIAADAGLAPEVRHLASSEAALTRPETRFDLVRIGIAMYGLEADASVRPSDYALRPAMRFESHVAAVRRVPAGTGVSYGLVEATHAATTLALVPAGYADGIPRSATGRAEVLLGGARRRVIGRIAMDQFVVDAGDAPVAVGDPVVVWGDPARGEPSADEWAEWAGTIGYEIVTRVGPRVPRRFTG